jgi:hypothetical protein
MSMKWVLLLLILLPMPLVGAPVVSLEGNAVKVTRVTPAGKVVFFGIARDGQGYSLRASSFEDVVEDTDKDGAVQLDLPRPVPFRSIWAAVDLTSGEYAIAFPEGFTPTVLNFPVAALHRHDNGQGKPDLLDDRRCAIEVLVVRPGQGAWRQSLGDGDPDDEDGAANGRIDWSVDKGRAVKNGPAAPADFDPGDVIVVMDPTRLELYATRLPGGGS